MGRMPALAGRIFVLHTILLCYTAANITVDKDVETGKALEQNLFGSSRHEYAKKKAAYDKAVKDQAWWTIKNRTCSQAYLPSSLSGCLDTKPQKCFGVEISYPHRVETDEPFPHWVEFLRNFPKCWARIAPLVCFVHYRPCVEMENPKNSTALLEDPMNSTDRSEIAKNSTGHYVLLELYSTDLCGRMRSYCDFALRHFPSTAVSYLSCNARLKDSDFLRRQKERNGSAVLVFNSRCELDFYNLSARKEPGQLADQAKSCLSPLVYVNSSEPTQRTHATPLVDDCYIPCSSTVYDANSLSALRVFTFLCFFLLLLFALHLLCRADELNFDMGISISFLAIVSTVLVAITFALSPFLGNGVVCLLDGKIRRFSGAFTSANGNDILCMMEAAYLKVFLVFAFWTSFIIVCNRLRNNSRANSLFFQQISAFCHVFISLFVTLWHREISIDPVPKVCHFFHLHSVWLIFVDFVLLLLVAFFILFLSKASTDSKKNGKNGLQKGQMLIDGTLNEKSHPNDGKLCADKSMVQHEQWQAPFLQRLLDGFSRQISPLFVMFAYFGCVLSFYPLAEKDESQLLSAQINCSLSVLPTQRWKDNEHMEICRPLSRIPLWYYANLFAVVFHLSLSLCVISGFLTSHTNNKSKIDIKSGGEETEDDDNKNEFEMDSLENVERPPEEQRPMNRCRGNPGSTGTDCRESVADSIFTYSGYAEISSASDNSAALTNERKSRSRKLPNLQRGRGRNRAQVERGRLPTLGQNGANHFPLGVHCTTPSTYSESLSAEYELRRNQQHPISVPSDGLLAGPTFAVPPRQLPVAAPTAPAPLFILLPWNQYHPNDTFHSPQNYNNNQQQNVGAGRIEFANMGKEDAIEGKINGAEGNSCTNESASRSGAEQWEERGKEEDEITSEDSDYPVSDHGTADSNDFCSDNSDPAEEQLWNERCRKAAQSQQESARI